MDAPRAANQPTHALLLHCACGVPYFALPRLTCCTWRGRIRRVTTTSYYLVLGCSYTEHSVTQILLLIVPPTIDSSFFLSSTTISKSSRLPCPNPDRVVIHYIVAISPCRVASTTATRVFLRLIQHSTTHKHASLLSLCF